MKKIQTPSYWKEEKYQPLVETVTVYGNKVLIPKNFLNFWEFQRKISKQANQPPQEYLIQMLNDFMTTRGRLAEDLGKVLLEIYQE